MEQRVQIDQQGRITFGPKSIGCVSLERVITYQVFKLVDN